MYIAKQAILTKDHIPDANVYVFYMDIRSPGKNYDEFVRRAQEEYGVQYIRGRVGKVYPRNGRMVVQGMDTLLGAQVEVDADLVVLATGIEAASGAKELAEKLRISYDQYGFYMESHVKLRPVETNTAGVYLAGVCQGPKDIPASVAQGSAAASKVQALFSKDTMETDPQVALVNERSCIACGKCIQVCPFGAIQWKELRGGIKKAEVLPSVCQGCGLCNATCPPKAVQLQHATDNQILAELNSLCA
jgi:heterodisulfide reductase subunit A